MTFPKFGKSSVLAVCLASLFIGAAQAETIAFFDLNGITGGQVDSGTQYQTGYSITYNADLTGWSKSGLNTVHALQITPSNWALMVYSGYDVPSANVYTLNSTFAANALGVRYWVSYDIAPTVYVNSGQATQAGDALRISVLNGSNAVVAYNDVAPGAWMGSQAFHKAYFSYLGDGTGDVKLQITTANPGNGYFAGAVDNISFESTQPAVPEPSTYALLGLGLAGLAALKLRRSA